VVGSASDTNVPENRITAGGKLLVDFIVKEGKVDLIYERYRLKKVGNLE